MDFMLYSTSYGLEIEEINSSGYVEKLQKHGFDVEKKSIYKERHNEYEDFWFITLKSLDDLIRLKDVLGRNLVIQDGFWEDVIFLEIYDGYRE